VSLNSRLESNKEEKKKTARLSILRMFWNEKLSACQTSREGRVEGSGFGV
jgi:hypothetical protein